MFQLKIEIFELLLNIEKEENIFKTKVETKCLSEMLKNCLKVIFKDEFELNEESDY